MCPRGVWRGGCEEQGCYKAEVLLPKLDHISFNRLFLWPNSKESFNYDLFILPVFVFFVCHAGTMAHKHTHALSVGIVDQFEQKKAERSTSVLSRTTSKTTARIFK